MDQGKPGTKPASEASQPSKVRASRQNAAAETRQFNEFVRSLYVPRTEEELRRIILSHLLTIVPGQNAVINAMNMRKRTIFPVYPTHPFSNQFLESMKVLIYQHPTFCNLEKRPRFTERLISDFLSVSKWHGLELYNDSFRPASLEDQMGIGICRKGPVCTGIAVLRDKWGFSAKDRGRMALLAHHFEQAFANVRAFERVQCSLEQSQAQLDAIPYGTVWLDKRGRVLQMNRRAQMWWTEFFPQERVGARLPRSIQQWMRPEKCVRPSRPLVRHSPDARLTIRFISLPSQQSHLLVLERRSLKPKSEDLQQLGLTSRETEVLLWIAQGKTNGEIAQILGGSRRTMDKHVQNILAKLSLENRASVILLVANLLHA